MSKTYEVANPRGIPKGTRILRTETKEYLEGDVYDGPLKGKDGKKHRFIEQGFVVEAGQ